LNAALFGQRDKITLETLNLIRGFSLSVNLMEIGADAQEDAPGTDRRQAAFVKALAQLHHMLDAIGLGQEASSAKSVHINLGPAGLIAAEKMAGKADARHGQTETPGQQQIDQAEADRVAGAPIHDAVVHPR